MTESPVFKATKLERTAQTKMTIETEHNVNKYK